MGKIIFILIFLIFTAWAIACGNVFAQRSVNSAQEAAKKARESLVTRPSSSSSQIEWLDKLVKTVNMNEPAPKGASTRKIADSVPAPAPETGLGEEVEDEEVVDEDA